jgi:hypothetical protein
MTANRFRKLALALPETVEQSHMGHPDFRVGGKIFASLGPDEDWGMVRLTPEEQASYVRTDADAFTPFKGAWGQTRLYESHVEVRRRCDRPPGPHRRVAEHGPEDTRRGPRHRMRAMP